MFPENNTTHMSLKNTGTANFAKPQELAHTQIYVTTTALVKVKRWYKMQSSYISSFQINQT
jgi:hypothetical protein